jgi:flagellar biosynthesis regulator FlbT
MQKVTLAIATKVGEKQYQQGDVVEVDRATRNNLVHLGRARDVATTKESATAPADGKVK